MYMPPLPILQPIVPLGVRINKGKRTGLEHKAAASAAHLRANTAPVLPYPQRVLAQAVFKIKCQDPTVGCDRRKRGLRARIVPW